MVSKIIFFILIVFLLTGCFPKNEVIIPPPNHSSNNSEKSIIQTKLVDNYILKRKYFLSYPEFESDQELTFPTISHVSLSPLPSGTKLKVTWIYEDGSFLCEPVSGVKIVNSRAISPFPACLVIDSGGKLNGFAYCHHPEYPIIHAKFKTITFQKTNIINPAPVHREIIYNGRSNTLIKMQYREINEGSAHPLFYQDLVYDLSESGIITFKGTKIEVIEATESLIRYRIIEGAENWN